MSHTHASHTHTDLKIGLKYFNFEVIYSQCVCHSHPQQYAIVLTVRLCFCLSSSLCTAKSDNTRFIMRKPNWNTYLYSILLYFGSAHCILLRVEATRPISLKHLEDKWLVATVLQVWPPNYAQCEHPSQNVCWRPCTGAYPTPNQWDPRLEVPSMCKWWVLAAFTNACNEITFHTEGSNDYFKNNHYCRWAESHHNYFCKSQPK